MTKTYFVGTPKDLSGETETKIAIPEEIEEKDLPADDYYWQKVTLNAENVAEWFQLKHELDETTRGPHVQYPLGAKMQERLRVQKIVDRLEAAMHSLEIENQDVT